MKSKVTAVLLTFFFGGLGIHKFYLGQNVAGILYLLFFWTFIPGIIAFFEFIFLLVMSDKDFNAKFNGMNVQYAAAGMGHQESSANTTDTLMKLKDLYDSGVITAEEYEGKRRKFLDAL